MNKKNILSVVLSALLLALVALLFFAPADFEGKVLQQADIQQGLANGQELKTFEEATGEKAYWTNSLFSGMPTFQITPTYASNRMLQWVVKVYTLWLPSPANLLFAMMLGFFIMCLCMRMRWPVALFGAVAWGFSTYFIIIIGAGHIWKFLTLAYIPPMIGGLVLCYRGKYWWGATITALFTALQLGSNHPQMTYYFLFVVGALMIAWLITDIKERHMKRWVAATACIIGAGGLGVTANLTSLYLSYEYSKETIRGKATDLGTPGEASTNGSGLDHDYITQWSYGIDETLTLLIPNVKGGASAKPVGSEMMPRSMINTKTFQESYLSPQEMQFAYYFMQYFGDQPMTNGPVYVGAFVLVLAVLGMFVIDGQLMGPMKWALFWVSVLAILLAWGHNFDALTTFFIDNVPFYNRFRTPSSMLVVVEFCVPLLAAMCLIKILRTPDFMKRHGFTFYVVMGAAAFVCLLGWIAPGSLGGPWSITEYNYLRENQLLTNPAYANVLHLIENSRLQAVSDDSLRSLVFIALGFGVMMLYFKGTLKSKPVTVCALTLVVLVDLFWVNKRYVDYENFTDPLPAQTAFEPTAADLVILKDTAMNYRVLDVDNFTQARSSYFHKTIGGYHAAKLTRYNDLIEHQIMKNNPQVINMLNGRYYIADGKAVYNPEAYGNAWLVSAVKYVATPQEEMDALSSLQLRRQAVAAEKFKEVLGTSAAVSPGDTIYETTYAPGALDYYVKSAKGGVAVFSEIFFPWGWEATIDGEPVEIGRVDYVLRALKVPAGEHRIRFEFKPSKLKTTNTLGVISVSLIYLLGLIAVVTTGWTLYRRRYPKPQKEEERSEKEETQKHEEGK